MHPLRSVVAQKTVMTAVAILECGHEVKALLDQAKLPYRKRCPRCFVAVSAKPRAPRRKK